jgi:class 3 adenylate cyclase
MSSSQIERKLAAIMFTDIVGFTKIMGDDESTALSILENQQSLINPIVKERKGTIIKKMGDGLLIEFPSTVEAVECATKMQDSIKSYNTSDDNIEFHIRIGIHLGDIVILGDDILGDGVNIASRIEPLASPDGICITDAVYQSVKSRLKLDFKRIDEVDLKHIDDKYTIYKIPKTELDINDQTVISHIKEESASIKITSLITFSNIPSEILKSSRYGILLALIIHPLFNLIDKYFLIRDNQLPFFQDFKIFPMSLTNAEWSLLLNFNSGGIISFLYFTGFISIFYGLFFFKKGIKVSFADIRNIDKLLDYMVTEIPQNIFKKYAILEKRGNTIIYYPYSRGFGWLEKTFLKFLLKYEQLELKFNGNVVKIYGLWITVRRLKKQLNVFKLL